MMNGLKLLWKSSLASLFALTGFAALSAPPDNASPPNQEATAFFETKVRPLLFEKCFGCHGEKVQRNGLRLDSRDALLKGGDNGPALVSGDPDKSLLLQAVHYDGKLKMPPSGKLTDDQIATLTTWVKMGAPWPPEQQKGRRGEGEKGKPQRPTPDAQHPSPNTQHPSQFWSFRPVKQPPIPKVKNTAWVKSPIDAFILAKLEAKGLQPAPPADKRTLLRRATFDLTGLPPTPEEVKTFLKDKSPNAFAKVVDRLLASPHYGERWGRHWLDVVRYVDSLDARGLGSEGDIAFAYRYRDWVVNALNQDMPYSQFMMNQVAGDVLPPDSLLREQGKTEGEKGRRGEGEKPTTQSPNHPITQLPNAQRPTPAGMNVPGTIATGMLAIGNWGNGDADKEKIITDIADDQVDVVSRAFLGLTVACARCHNHKFDPISQKDYYGLAGIFFSTHILPKLTPKGAGETPMRIPLLSKAEREQRDTYTKQVAELEKQAKTLQDTQYRAWAQSLLPQTARYVYAAWEYRNRPAEQAGLSLAEFAAKQGLHEYATRQWMDYLGMSDYRLMLQTLHDLLGNAGVEAWKGATDTPSLTINTNKEARTILTFTLPPRSVAVHPGPTAGVAVGWQSPMVGTVAITGRVVDADPACGDGIAWVIQRRAAGGAQELASGEFPNGGAQDYAQGKGAERLHAVVIKAGDSLELLVLPKNGHACDTTTVELNIAETGGKRVWNLTHDLLDGPLQGNPHRDSYGNAGVWRFSDMASSRPVAGDPKAEAALTAWQQAVAEAVKSGPPSPPSLGGAGGLKSKIEAAAQAFQQAFQIADNRSPFWINSRDDDRYLPPEARDTLAKLNTELDALRKNPPPPIEFANGALEGGIPESPYEGFHDVRVHIRGSYLRLGDLVPRHFPVVLAGENQPPITQGSGRLELARWLASPTHPLTARVMVNRLWQHHFGAGIVRTPSNFGALGERPTHPELLDWLAFHFVEGGNWVIGSSGNGEKRNQPAASSQLPSLYACGWSLKKMHRMMMLSATYQQASIPQPKTLKIDPDNRLFGRMNRWRLEAEALRDNLLAVSGKLDPTLGGVATRDFNAPRRTLYMMTIRSDRTGFGPLFDMADSTNIVAERVSSTVAPQALFLLNDPFALMQTKALAERLLKEVPNSDTARIQRAYSLLYARPATAEEVKIGLEFLAKERKEETAQARSGVVQASAPAASNSDLKAWTAYCQILLCANEFLYVD